MQAGLLHRADHLSARHHPRALSLLAVPLAADAGHRVLARRAGRRRRADAHAATSVSGGRWRRLILAVGRSRFSGATPRAPRSTCERHARSSRSTASRRRSGFRACAATPSASTSSGCCEPRRFEPLQVLDDVSFTLRRGETLGIMGRNGCGKSTLLKIICGIYQPDQGTRRRTRAPSRRSSSSASAGIPELDAVDNVCLIGVGHGPVARGDPRAAWTSILRVRRARAVRESEAEALLERHGVAARPTRWRSRRCARCWCSTRFSRSATRASGHGARHATGSCAPLGHTVCS